MYFSEQYIEENIVHAGATGAVIGGAVGALSYNKYIKELESRKLEYQNELKEESDKDERIEIQSQLHKLNMQLGKIKRMGRLKYTARSAGLGAIGGAVVHGVH
jgi:ribosomal protein S2